MASATVGGVRYRITADKDLGDSWAVAVVPPGGSVLASLIVKLQGNDRAAVIKGALTTLKGRGQIDSFELDPAPPAPASVPASAPVPE